MSEKITTLTRADLADAVYREVGFSYAECQDFVGLVFEEMSKALQANDEIKIPLFGSFRTRDKKPRVGRNPKTKEPKVISARRVVTFRPSTHLKEIMNEQK